MALATLTRHGAEDGSVFSFLGRDENGPHRREALKVLRPEISNNETFQQRFIREADSIAALEHQVKMMPTKRGIRQGELSTYLPRPGCAARRAPRPAVKFSEPLFTNSVEGAMKQRFTDGPISRPRWASFTNSQATSKTAV